MLRLADGRICITYGVRAKPFGMRAKISRDEGQTWGDEIMLARRWRRPRPGLSAQRRQRPDGKVVTVYYFNDDPKETRYIVATIWDPASATRIAPSSKRPGTGDMSERTGARSDSRFLACRRRRVRRKAARADVHVRANRPGPAASRFRSAPRRW